MTDKEIRRLKREDLLQILIEQQRRIDELTASLEEKQAALDDRTLKIDKAGSIAEASMALSDVFTSAQKAVDQYKAEMQRRTDEAFQEARTEAEEIVTKARHEARDIVDRAKSEASATAGDKEKGGMSIVFDEEDKPKRRGFLRRNRD